MGLCSPLCLQYLGATAEVPELLCTNYLKAVSGKGGCCPLGMLVQEVSLMGSTLVPAALAECSACGRGCVDKCMKSVEFCNVQI